MIIKLFKNNRHFYILNSIFFWTSIAFYISTPIVKVPYIKLDVPILLFVDAIVLATTTTDGRHIKIIFPWHMKISKNTEVKNCSLFSKLSPHWVSKIYVLSHRCKIRSGEPSCKCHLKEKHNCIQLQTHQPTTVRPFFRKRIHTKVLNKQCPQLRFNRSLIVWRTQIRYLGIILDNKLIVTPNKQIIKKTKVTRSIFCLLLMSKVLLTLNVDKQHFLNNNKIQTSKSNDT